MDINGLSINWQRIITVLLTAIVFAAFIRISRSNGKEGKLSFGAPIKILGLVCLIFSVVPLYIYLTKNYRTDVITETYALIGISFGFGVGAIYALGEAFFVKGDYDQLAITYRTPWTGVKDELWSGLKSITFNHSTSWYLLEFDSGAKIRLSTFLNGHRQLIELLELMGSDAEIYVDESI